MNSNEHIKVYQPYLAYIRAARVRYVIGGSYALRKWRRVNDIDALIHPVDASKLTGIGLGEWVPAPSGWGQSYAINTPAGRIEMFDTPNIPGFGYADMRGTARAYERDEFENEVWSLELTLIWKQKFNRPKDQEGTRLVTSR